MRLSERIEAAVTNSQVNLPELREWWQMAHTMEQAIDDRQPWRATDPETSHWEGDPETLSEQQRALRYTFMQADRPLDEYKMTDAYVSLQVDNEWMPFIDPELQTTNLRKRRKDLERLGILVRLDGEGVSPVGRNIGRYVLTVAGRRETT